MNFEPVEGLKNFGVFEQVVSVFVTVEQLKASIYRLECCWVTKQNTYVLHPLGLIFRNNSCWWCKLRRSASYRGEIANHNDEAVEASSCNIGVKYAFLSITDNKWIKKCICFAFLYMKVVFLCFKTWSWFWEHLLTATLLWWTQSGNNQVDSETSLFTKISKTYNIIRFIGPRFKN